MTGAFGVPASTGSGGDSTGGDASVMEGRRMAEYPVGDFGESVPRNAWVRPGSVAHRRGIAPVTATSPWAGAPVLDSDGLPHVGAVVWPGNVYCSYKSEAMTLQQ